MRNVATIAQAFYTAAAAVTGIAKVEFITQFSLDELKQVARTPLLLINPHMMYLAYGRHRQRGTQLLLNAYLVGHNRRGERNQSSALELIGILDGLDTAVNRQTFGLAIQPLEVYRREAVQVAKGLSVVRTIYATVIYTELAVSKFVYLDGNSIAQTIEFNFVSTSFQTEEMADTNDYDRALNGALRSYSRVAKRKYEIRFTLIPASLKNSLLALKTVGSPITYYRDKTAGATMTCYWVNDFNFYEERTRVVDRGHSFA